MRRGKPELLVAVLIFALLASYVWYTQRVVVAMRADATSTSRMYSRIFRALGDSSPGAETAALIELAQSISDQGVPLIWIDRDGKPADHLNLPFDKPKRVADDDPRVAAYVSVLAKQHPPIDDSLVGKIYYGDPPIVRGLRYIPALQAVTAVILLLAGLYIIYSRHDAARERLWAGMARESAHQLGTPLSSLSGWVELLEEDAGDGPSRAAVTHMRGDLERLERVANRFERIGREPKLEDVDVASIVHHIAKYFRARVPTLANTIVIESSIDDGLPSVRGDAVLLEWAVEVLTKNAIDALAGRGGRVRLSVKRHSDGSTAITVADDGPGIPRELRTRIFDAGFSTKKTGWGIGLSLAKRIVEENHQGTLTLLPSEQGAAFEIQLH